MKCSMHLKLVAVAALLVSVLLAGSAWAGETEVRAAITAYGLTAGNTGNTIDVTGSVTNATTMLDLGDISGLVINWAATLEASSLEGWQGEPRLIQASGGTFNIKSGGKIRMLDPDARTRDPEAPYEYLNLQNGDYWPRMIRTEGSTVTVESGAELELTTAEGAAISGSDRVTINGGTIKVPFGEAFSANIENTINDATGIQGHVMMDTDKTIEVYGANNLITTDSCSWEGLDGWTATVKDGAKLTIELPITNAEGLDVVVEQGGELVYAEDSTVENNGTITVEVGGKLTNDGTINNNSSETIENHGTLVNNGTINNKNTGKITNTGTIDNANGKINNNGAIDNTDGTIKSDADAFSGNAPTGNQIEPIEPNSPSGSSSGCDAGFGVIALMLAGFSAIKLRRA